MGKPFVDFVEEENLCVQIQKFRCLYDKASKGYKEKDRVSNAWRSVVLEATLFSPYFVQKTEV